MVYLEVVYGSSKTSLSSVFAISDIVQSLDSAMSVHIQVRDNEGALYATWKDKQFETIWIIADTYYYIFAGYVLDITFEENVMLLACRGFGYRLEITSVNKNYILAEGKVKSEPPYSGSNYKLELETNEDEAFTWDDDSWIQTPKGILITDKTTDTEIVWSVYSGTNSGFDDESLEGGGGTIAATLTAKDTKYLQIVHGTNGEIGQTPFSSCYYILEMAGDTFSNESIIKRIDIELKLTIQITHMETLYGWEQSYCNFVFQIYNWITETWENLMLSPTQLASIRTSSTKIVSFAKTISVIKDNVAEYVHDTGTDYNIVKIRFKGDYYAHVAINEGEVTLKMDYCKTTVSYRTTDFTPAQGEITDNGASWIECTDIDFVDTGVLEHDGFMIGENAETILIDMISEAELGAYIGSTFSKFFARVFRGVMALQPIQAILETEIAHWFESIDDQGNCVISCLKESDFVAGTSITYAKYDRNFQISRPANTYGRVEVYGSVFWGIYYSVDTGIESPRTKVIIDDSIATQADAKAVGDAFATKLASVDPSIVVSIHGTDGLSYKLGQKVAITFTYPAIAEASYVINRITRRLSTFPEGDLITTLFLGTYEPEYISPDIKSKNAGVQRILNPAKMAYRTNSIMKAIKKIESKSLMEYEEGAVPVLSHSSLTNLSNDDHAQYHNNDRGDARYPLKTNTITPSSPLSGGGDLSANRTISIADASTSAKGAVQLQTTVDTSETKALTPKALNDHKTSSDHDGRYYTETELNQQLMIGSANAAKCPCSYINHTNANSPADWCSAGGVIKNYTAAISAKELEFRVPLPTNRGGLKLYIKDIYTGIYKADASNYIDRIIIVGVQGATATNVVVSGSGGQPSVSYTSNGEKQFTPTSPVDMSSYSEVWVRFRFTTATQYYLILNGFMANCYYDT